MKKLLVLAALSAMALGAKAEYYYTTTVNIPEAQAVYFYLDVDADSGGPEFWKGAWDAELHMLLTGDKARLAITWAEQFALLNESISGRKATKVGDGVFSADMERGDARSFILIALNDATELAPGVSYSIYSGTAPGLAAEDKSFVLDSGMIASGTTATDSPTPAPEPTSGLLMLVGLAGLALKRKRA